MNDEEKQELEYALADIITARPYEFRVGRKTLRLYPVTLAKTFVLRRLTDKLDMDTELLKANPYMECLRLAETHREVVTRILAIHTAPNTWKDLHDSRGTAMRQNLLRDVKPEHIAGLLMAVLTADKTDQLEEHLGMNAERERLKSAIEAKGDSNKNNLSFGGKSIFGTFIGQLKEMGYSDDEILFERGYSYLRLMLADKVTSMYLSDEELDKLPQEDGGLMLDGDDDGDLDTLASLIKQGGLN